MSQQADTIRLKSPFLQIEIDRLGAELASIKDAKDREYLWQGDPEVWAGRAPVLFPIVGRIRGDAYTHQGKTYEMKQHGFARRQEFHAQQRNDTSARFELSANSGTLEQYPFEFRLTIDYQLNDEVLETCYTIHNAGNEPMPYALGAHPGFSCRWEPQDRNWQPEDLRHYLIQFDQRMTLPDYGPREGLLELRQDSLLDNADTIRLGPEVFDTGARVYHDIPSKIATLRRDGDSRSITVRYHDFPHLGIWSAPRAPYVCIEPWLKTADTAESTTELSQKRDMRVLAPGGETRYALSIEVRGTKVS